MSIKDRLKIARESLGKSQREMSTLSGASFGVWQAYEAGSSVPGGKVLEALARLGFNVNWLLTGEEGMLRGEEKVNQIDYNAVYSRNELLQHELQSSVTHAMIEMLTGLDNNTAWYHTDRKSVV